jgi:hypothetical protein
VKEEDDDHKADNDRVRDQIALDCIASSRIADLRGNPRVVAITSRFAATARLTT